MVQYQTTVCQDEFSNFFATEYEFIWHVMYPWIYGLLQFERGCINFAQYRRKTRNIDVIGTAVHGQRGRAHSHNELLRGIITADARERDLEITCYCDLDRVPIVMRFGHSFHYLAHRPILVRSPPLHVVAPLQLDIHTYMPHVRPLVDDMSFNGDNKPSF